MNYKELYEKRVKAERFRGYASIVSGAVSIIGGILMLKQLRPRLP
jgi:hypothetical protein